MLSKFALPENVDSVIAMDFGSHRSGYAFVHKKLNAIYIEEEYNNNRVYKDYSAILYDSNETPLFWGTQALEEATNVNANYYLITDMKMELKNDEIEIIGNNNQNECPFKIFREVKGKRFNVVKVISDFLEMLKNTAIEKLESMIDAKYNIQKTVWVITIPAIWSDKMKSMMLWACNKAGLGYKNCKLFSFALEPECGILSSFKQSVVVVGQTILVVDLGGGTIDISAFQKVNEKFVQLIKPTGCAAGGNYVDEKFYDFLFRKFETKMDLKELRKHVEQKQEFLSVKKNWLSIKEKFTGNEKVSSKIRVRMLVDKLQKDEKKITGCKDLNKDGEIILTKNDIISFFADSLFKIISTTQGAIKTIPINVKLETIVIIGGYGSSKYIQEELKKHLRNYGNEIKTIPQSGSCVLKGAVYYGLDRSLISKRISEFTFGVNTSEHFKQGHHEEKRKYQDNNQFFCRNVFKKIIEVGDTIDFNFKFETLFRITQGGNKTGCCFELLSCETKAPKYTDDADILANIIIPSNLYYNENGTLKGGKKEIDVKLFVHFSECLMMEVHILNEKFQVEAEWPTESGFKFN